MIVDCLQLGHIKIFTSTSIEEESAQKIPSSEISIAVAGDVQGGGTGMEFKENLLKVGEQSWNKWFHAGYIHSTWVELRLKTVYQVTRYGLCSANDCPHRDPRSWRLRGQSAADDQWVTLHEVERFTFSGRWQWVYFDILQPISVKTLRLEVVEINQPQGEGLFLTVRMFDN